VNDVVLAAASRAFQRHARRRAAGFDFPVQAIVPVDTRLPADPPEGNRFGLAFVPLPLATDDPMRRLTELGRRTAAIKKGPEAIVTSRLLEVIGRAPRALQEAAIDFFGTRGSVVATDVRGPTRRLALAGQPIRSVIFFVPQSDGIGVGLSALSYAGELRVGLSTDAALVPDPESIVRDIEEALAPAGCAASAPPSIEKGEATMAKIERSLRIEAPVEDVFEYVTNIRRFREWWPSLAEVRNPSHEQAVKGSTYEWTYKMAGFTFNGKDEFFEVIPGKLARNGTLEGELRHMFEHRVEPEDGGTRFTLLIDYSLPAGVIGRIADRALLARYNEREADQVVANLRAICEAEARGARKAAARRSPAPPPERERR
jgi:uncharacterized protein YndB with AHSA1/START domain